MRLRRQQDGFVLVTALTILLILMLLSVGIIAVVSLQNNDSGQERRGEAAYNLAVSALQSEVYQLRLSWPATAAQALPACNQSVAQTLGCEGTALAQEVQAATPGPDYANATWSAQAFDNTSATYSASLASTAPSWDSNGDNVMWVRAQATSNGQTRTVIEQVKRRLQTVSLPETVVTAGGINTNSNGTPTIIEAKDSASGVIGPVDVRCGTAGSAYGTTNCTGWGKASQLDPPSAYNAGYVDPSGSSSSLTTAQITSLVQEARADGTLYNLPGGGVTDTTAISGCPPAATYSTLPAGQSNPLVVVEGTGSCTIKNDFFSSTLPGMLLFLQGSVSLGPGNPNFYGVLYMANQNAGTTPAAGSVCSAAQLSGSPLVTTAGNATVNGAVLVDGCGTVNIQDNGDALNFSLNALQAVQTYGTATASPGTFRVVSQ